MPRRSPALILVHIVWATLGRRPMLPASFDSTLAAILGRTASESGCWILEFGSASDHVHVLLRLSPVAPLSSVVKGLKGAGAHEVNHHGLLLERLALQAGYWAESFGPADVQSLAEYVRVQRTHYDDSHPAE